MSVTKNVASTSAAENTRSAESSRQKINRPPFALPHPSLVKLLDKAENNEEVIMPEDPVVKWRQKLLREKQIQEEYGTPMQKFTGLFRRTNKSYPTSIDMNASIFQHPYNANTMRILFTGEVLYKFSEISLRYFLTSKYSDSLGVIPLYALYIIRIQEIAGSLIGITIAWLSDRSRFLLFSKYNMFLYSLIIFFIIALLSMIASIPYVPSGVRLKILYALLGLIGVFPAMLGVRSIFLVNQIGLFANYVDIRMFIFWVVTSRFIGQIFSVGLTYKVNETTMYIINNSIMTVMSFLYLLYFILKKDKFATNSFSVAKPDQRSHSYENEICHKKCSKVIIGFLPLIGYGITHNAVHNTVREQFQTLYLSTKDIPNRPPYEAIQALIGTVTVLSFEFIALRVSKTLKTILTDSANILVSFFFLGVAAGLSGYTLHLVETNYKLPGLGVGQVNLFHFSETEVSLDCPWFKTTLNRSGDHYMTRVNVKGEKTISMDFIYGLNHTKRIEKISASEMKSTSYFIVNQTFQRLSGFDSLYYAPAGVNGHSSPISFALSVNSNLTGQLLLYDPSIDENEQTSERTPVATVDISRHMERAYFIVEPMLYTAKFYGTQSHGYTATVLLEAAGSYAMIISGHNIVKIETYELLAPFYFSYLYLIPAMIAMNIAFALFSLSIFRCSIEMPAFNSRTIVFCYLNFIGTSGLGVELILKLNYWFRRVSFTHLVVCSSFHFLSFITYIVLVIFVIDNKK